MPVSNRNGSLRGESTSRGSDDVAPGGALAVELEAPDLFDSRRGRGLLHPVRTTDECTMDAPRDGENLRILATQTWDKTGSRTEAPGGQPHVGDREILEPVAIKLTVNHVGSFSEQPTPAAISSRGIPPGPMAWTAGLGTRGVNLGSPIAQRLCSVRRTFERRFGRKLIFSRPSAISRKLVNLQMPRFVLCMDVAMYVQYIAMNETNHQRVIRPRRTRQTCNALHQLDHDTLKMVGKWNMSNSQGRLVSCRLGLVGDESLYGILLSASYERRLKFGVIPESPWCTEQTRTDADQLGDSFCSRVGHFSL